MPTASRTIVPLDSVDRRMLDVLQREGRIPNAALAERLHLSPSPCLRRMRALEHSGVVAGYRAILDREALGLGLTVFVELKVEGHSRHSADTIREAMMRTPEVVSAYVVSGSADILAEVVVTDLPAYERLLFDVLLELPQVTDVRSNFALRALKPAGPVPLPGR
ncbi:MAG TPA: Lrp/AsnC family transcriptional regulator [Solirubrobacteraceae bacterium]|nr:Lrp/AsnC family transcriptional regulator [Solirubrobacteraceae bacterium]